jgi:hypothetical protein
MCLYLSLSALHVSNCLVHHHEQRFFEAVQQWYEPVRLAGRWSDEEHPITTQGTVSPLQAYVA